VPAGSSPAGYAPVEGRRNRHRFLQSRFPFLPSLASADGTANAVTKMAAAAIAARALRSISVAD